MIPKTLKEFKCQACAKIYCPKCLNPPHNGYTCEANRDNLQSDPQLRELFTNNPNFTVCPWCRNTIERTGGCKYMTCKCANNRHFCFDCKAKLNNKHEKHECITQDILSNRCSIF